MNAARVLDALAAPLDSARRGALSAVMRRRALASVVRRRDVRMPWLATAQVLALLAVTLVRPVWLFVLGPVVLGVPHLASDVRYLVLRGGVAREVVAVACVAGAGVAALRVLELAHHAVGESARLEIALGGAWIAAAVLLGAVERRRAWPLLGLPVVALAAAAAWRQPMVARAVLAQGHNVVGVAAWLWLFRGNRRVALAPVAAIAAGVVVLASGAAIAWTARAHGLQGFGFDLARVGSSLLPGGSTEGVTTAALVFVFLQAVHYAAWLVWIPQDALPGEGTFTFRMTGRALVRDFGAAGLGLALAASVALAGAALLDARAAVGGYMAVASFHAYLELAMLAYFGARGAGPR